MGDRTFSRTAYTKVHDDATSGGKTKATQGAEERIRSGLGIDPLVDPKGLPHLGPVRMSLPRFEKQGDLWRLTRGIPMCKETLLDTTGSMGNNVNIAFGVLPDSYDMLTGGKNPILGRYDVQICTSTFNDVADGTPVHYRSQFEMDEKIADQMTRIASGNGRGNGKEDPQFALFGAAYLTAASINRYGLKYYHFAISDEPFVQTIDPMWLKTIFGDDVLERAKLNGYDFEARNLPHTSKVVKDLQSRAHAFFLQVGNRSDVSNQWTDLYGGDHFIKLGGDGTSYLHYIEACIIGLTEGVLDLASAKDFLLEHKLSKDVADRIIRSVAHIPLGAQMLCPNFDKVPMAGDMFREKTDLWPVDPNEINPTVSETDEEGGPTWL